MNQLSEEPLLAAYRGDPCESKAAGDDQRLGRMTLALLVLLLVVGNAMAQTTAFTYQGKLTDSGSPANGQYDFQFKLFDTAAIGGGTEQGSTVTVSNVTVTAGLFNAHLDFGSCASCFDGSPRFLEIAVKLTSGSTFTTLSPREPVSSNPYAIRSLNATTADGLSVACVNCITGSQIQSVQGSQVTGNIAGNQIDSAIPVASVPAGSASYVQIECRLRQCFQRAASADRPATGSNQIAAATDQRSNVPNLAAAYADQRAGARA